MTDNYEGKAFLFKNDKYEQGGSHPIYKGNVTIDGRKRNISLWLKMADGNGRLEQGTMFLAGEVDEWAPEDKGQPASAPQPAPTPQPKPDDIPF